MQQVANIKEVFREYFSLAIVPDRIIELGTAWGTFTRIVYDLRREINDDFLFFTIDNLSEIQDIPYNMIYCNMNIFLNIDFIGSLVTPKTLILCDNGNKPGEVRLLTPYLKDDCVIMAHDYTETKESYHIYAGEIIWDDVKDLGLERYHYDLMKEAAWLSLKTKI